MYSNGFPLLAECYSKMKIKFGNLELDEWFGTYHWEAHGRIGNRPNSKGGMTAVAIVTAGAGYCYVNFHNPDYLQDLFPYKNPVPGTIDECKQKVDRFLIRMANLTIFI